MTSGVRRVDLVENGDPVEVRLPTAVGVALVSSGFIDARPAPGGSVWELRPLTKVGAMRVGDVEVHVAPKVDIARVVFLLGYASGAVRWQHDPVRLSRAPDLMTAVVEAFTRLAERALLQGLLQGYRTVEETLPVLRGRVREADQLRRRFAFMVPVEVRYDDFTVDTAENRLLRAAVLRALRLPGLDRVLRQRLRRLDLRLADVTPVRSVALLEDWRPSRLNARYHDSLYLADVVVRATSFELDRPADGDDGLAVHGFVVDMARVFEAFVCRALGERLQAYGGSTRTQDVWTLDRAEQLELRPDLVWYSEAMQPRGVIDAKYKAERPSGFPFADLYQMLAYCTALGLPVGHLVYAKGNERGRVHEVRGADVVLRAHTLDLSVPPPELLARCDGLAATIAQAAVRPDVQARTPAHV